MFDYVIERPDNAQCRLVLAHGAGAGKNSDFMQHLSQLLVARNIEVVRFNFTYMQTIEHTGRRRPPEKADVMLTHFSELLNHLNTPSSIPLWLGGKSMGGRMATMLVERTPAQGAVVFGYPFHPPGKPEKLRTEHLQQNGKPVHIFKGERDTFGTREETANFNLHSKVALHWLEDGDHSLQPRQKSGYTYPEHMQKVADATASILTNGANL